MIELMVVIVLIGVMSAAIIPQMRGSYQDALLRSTSRELVETFDVAYSRAVSFNQTLRVVLDENTGRYAVARQVFSGGQEEWAPLRDLPGGEGELDKRISVKILPADGLPTEQADGENAPAPEQAPEASTDATPPKEGIDFYPDGTTDAVAILLRDQSGFRLLLKLNPITARVRITELGRE